MKALLSRLSMRISLLALVKLLLAGPLLMQIPFTYADDELYLKCQATLYRSNQYLNGKKKDFILRLSGASRLRGLSLYDESSGDFIDWGSPTFPYLKLKTKVKAYPKYFETDYEERLFSFGDGRVKSRFLYNDELSDSFHEMAGLSRYAEGTINVQLTIYRDSGQFAYREYIFLKDYNHEDRRLIEKFNDNPFMAKYGIYVVARETTKTLPKDNNVCTPTEKPQPPKTLF